MRENTRSVAIVIGAAVGGLVGFLFFTEEGRRWRRSLEPALDDISYELGQFRGTLGRAAGVATEGWAFLASAFGDESGHRQPGQGKPS